MLERGCQYTDLRQLAKIGRAPWISRQGPWTSRHGELSRVPPQSKTARQHFSCTDFCYKTQNFLQIFVIVCFKYALESYLKLICDFFLKF